MIAPQLQYRLHALCAGAELARRDGAQPDNAIRQVTRLRRRANIEPAVITIADAPMPARDHGTMNRGAHALNSIESAPNNTGDQYSDTANTGGTNSARHQWPCAERHLSTNSSMAAEAKATTTAPDWSERLLMRSPKDRLGIMRCADSRAHLLRRLVGQLNLAALATP